MSPTEAPKTKSIVKLMRRKRTTGHPVVRRLGRMRRLGAPLRRLATLLSRWGQSLDPVWSTPNQFIRPGELLKLPNVGRLDFEALRDGRVEVKYGALDPLWKNGDEASGMVNLREHVVRLCLIANELAGGDQTGSWWPVSENLMLAASITDLSADTDLQNTSMMCRPAAEYEDVNSQLTEKHLAGVIVTTLVWTAYECAVEAVAGGEGKRKPKGALGRDLILEEFGDQRFPHLRATVMRALSTAPKPPDFTSSEARRALAIGAWAALGAEHLRQLRNAMVHGSVRKPEPRDWGKRSNYIIDADPVIMQFEVNVRLLLLLIQILALQAVEPADALSGWRAEADSADVVLRQLHCVVEKDDQLALPLDDAPLRTADDWQSALSLSPRGRSLPSPQLCGG